MTVMGVLRTIAEQHPWIKSTLKTLISPFRATTSGSYSRLKDQERSNSIPQLKNSWQAKEIPSIQRIGVDRALDAYRTGVTAKEFDVLVGLLRSLLPADSTASPAATTLLEIGCSSGYYSEVLAIKDVPLQYSGCDYSPAFIEMAKRYYPELDFQVEDATALGYDDASFDIVVSGCCLLHIADYPAAIQEAARVARTHIIFHRTPVLHLRPTTYFTKQAYGVKTIEIHFNEEELVRLFTANGLRVRGIATLNADWRQGDAYTTKSYLCEKTSINQTACSPAE